MSCAGKCGQLAGGDEQCGTENGTESGHGRDDGGLEVLIEGRSDLGIEVGEALVEGQGVGGELGDDRGGDVLAGQRDRIALVLRSAPELRPRRSCVPAAVAATR